jgi:hypothetical protein
VPTRAKRVPVKKGLDEHGMSFSIGLNNYTFTIQRAQYRKKLAKVRAPTRTGTTAKGSRCKEGERYYQGERVRHNP